MSETIRPKKESEKGEKVIIQIIATICQAMIGLLLVGWSMADSNMEAPAWQQIMLFLIWATVIVGIWVK